MYNELYEVMVSKQSKIEEMLKQVEAVKSLRK